MAKSLYRPLINFSSLYSSLHRPVRFYSRWMHRKPVKVLLPFQPKSDNKFKKETIIDLPTDFLRRSAKEQIVEEPKKQSDDVLQTKDSFKNLKDKKEKLLKKRLFYLSQKKVFDDNNEIIYNKLNANDSKLRYSVKFYPV